MWRRRRLQKVLANQECQKIFQTLACGIGDECYSEELIFSRILILTDPDMDGAHSRILLLSFFDRYLKSLLDSGLVSVIIPPLFRFAGEHLEQNLYAWNEQERVHLLEKLAGSSDVAVTRFKGVAQFSSEECVQLLLNPVARKQVNLGHHNDDRIYS